MERYDPVIQREPYFEASYAEMEKENCGEWVRYSDVKDAIMKLSKKWKEESNLIDPTGDEDGHSSLLCDCAEELEKILKEN